MCLLFQDKARHVERISLISPPREDIYLHKFCNHTQQRRTKTNQDFRYLVVTVWSG